MRLVIEVETVSPPRGRVLSTPDGSPGELLADHWHEVSFVGWLGLLHAVSELLDGRYQTPPGPPPPSPG